MFEKLSGYEILRMVGEWTWQPFTGNIGDEEWSTGYLVNTKTGYVRQCTRGARNLAFACQTVVYGLRSDLDEL